MSADDYSNEELLALDHNDHLGAFQGYLHGSRHASDKQAFLLSWLQPCGDDLILECGSSGGKTSIDFARHSDCYCLGVDFDPSAVSISRAMRDEHFPELTQRCQFECGDLATMHFEHRFNKVLMPDFSEHIPDRVFCAILANIKEQLPGATLYIYTPNRSHIFEIMKQHDFILKNPPGHINVKSRRELTGFLQEQGWDIQQDAWRVSSFPVLKLIEQVIGRIPFLGNLFQRRIVVTATPAFG
jgi:SAM-dependent methyltransferase